MHLQKKKTIQYADERCFIQRGDIMQNTQEKIVTYEEIQANPMLKWFFEWYSNDEIKRTAEDKFFKEWQEYVK